MFDLSKIFFLISMFSTPEEYIVNEHLFATFEEMSKVSSLLLTVGVRALQKANLNV